MVVHDRRDSAPSGFVHVGAAPSDTVLNLRLGLTQGNFAGLEEALYAVSTPGSDLYGQHLSKEETEAFVAPTAETSTAVQSWLSSHGLSATAATPAGDWLKLSLTVEQANELLDADFSTFKDQETGKQTIRTLSYSVPAELKSHITFVHPTIMFPIKPFGKDLAFRPLGKAKRASDAAPASCADAFTPVCLQELYGIPATKATQSSNVLAVSGFILQYANQADLQLFLQYFRPDLSPPPTFTLQTLDGGSNPQTPRSGAGIEANLDTQYTVGIASGVPVNFISVGENNPDGVDGFYDILEFLLGEKVIPNVLSTSYGFNEFNLPISIATTLCNAYAQVGARGTSVFFSSGDGGVSGSQSTVCTTFVPTFPSTCPYVTSVGGTQGVTESAAPFSSGGFSNYFPIPSYQAAFVKNYVSGLGSKYAGLFNSSGRAFPDVSAAGTNVVIAWNDQFGLVDGTSCSTPITASIVALLNDQLITAGKKPLGFLNPFLYQNQAIFTDITSGTNPGCNTNGFSSGVGWDPVTGVGSPVFANLRAAVGL
ncbi:subtilisin-like protein [Artomyces pyxidatus]|uniref:Subtilisin-like protein n=1 Tax=Artomyces pyxidatus TaxID=48021 RepID=A0ACB8T0C7_9AGAM|nr:subtilisin-like protein [Artomyces pyxidatus]